MQTECPVLKVTPSFMVTLAAILWSELRCWHQCPDVKGLLCISPNLGHIPASPFISCLASVRWQSQHRGVEAATLCFSAISVKSLPLSTQQQGEVTPWSLKVRCVNKKEFIFSKTFQICTIVRRTIFPKVLPIVSVHYQLPTNILLTNTLEVWVPGGI